MYSEEIVHNSSKSDVNTNSNELRNTYFKNRSCLTTLLDFLNQEIVIIAGEYFSTPEGGIHIIQDDYLYYDLDEYNQQGKIWDVAYVIDREDSYHIAVLDDYITIVAQNRKCIFTNKDMDQGIIVGTIIWVENFSELLEKFSNKNLKRLSKAIIHPHYKKIIEWGDYEGIECLNLDFFCSLKITKPEIIFKYTINSFMENEYLDVYKKLKINKLNALVDKFIPEYKRCDSYEEDHIKEFNTSKLCTCGGLRVLCSLYP